MASVEEIIQTMFGGNITVDAVISIFVSLYAVVLSIADWRSKRALIKADKQLTATDKQLTEQKEELDQIKKGLTFLGEMICVAYLGNPNVDENTKKKIAVAATNLEKVAKIKLADTAEKLVTQVTTYIPGTNLEKEREALTTEKKQAEEIVDTSTKTISNIINNMEI